MKNVRRKKMVWICIVTLIAVLSWSIAWADFYVVASGKRAKRTILVSPKSTAAASGTALLNALNGITDAGVTNPYLIIIEPGIYDIGTSSLQMKEYVDIQGSGEEVTKITGTISGVGSGVLEGADNAEVRFLTVENPGPISNSVAIYNSGVSPAITHVTVKASGSTSNSVGILNDSSSPTMTHVTVTASGTGHNHGIRNETSSAPTMTHVTAAVSGGEFNYGISNYYASPVMNNVKVTVSGGGECYGIINANSSPTLTHVKVTALYIGVFNNDSSTCKIDHSVISGVTNTVWTESGCTMYIGNTRLDGGPETGLGTCICAGVYDEDYTFYASTCP